MARESAEFTKTVKRSDLGFAIADTVIALRSIQLALIAVKTGNDKLLEEQIARLDKQGDELWARFQELMGQANE